MSEYKCKKQCGKCCTEIYLPMNSNVKDDEREWINGHELCEIVEKDGRLHLRIETKCKYLKNNKCSRYDNRPKICREYDCRTAIF